MEGTGFVAQTATQVIAVVAVTLWTAVATAIVALLVSVVAPIRVAAGRSTPIDEAPIDDTSIGGAQA